MYIFKVLKGIAGVVVVTVVLSVVTKAMAEEVSLVIPTWTNHWSDKGTRVKFNNHNPGVGVLWSTPAVEGGLLWLAKDSYHNPNLYVYLGGVLTVSKAFKLTAGVSYGFGYVDPHPVPMLGFQYKVFKFTTTAPFGRAVGHTDYAHVDLVIPFTF